MNSWAVAGLIVGIAVVAAALMIVMLNLLIFYLGLWVGGVLSTFVVLVAMFLILGVVFKR